MRSLDAGTRKPRLVHSSGNRVSRCIVIFPGNHHISGTAVRMCMIFILNDWGGQRIQGYSKSQSSSSRPLAFLGFKETGKRSAKSAALLHVQIYSIPNSYWQWTPCFHISRSLWQIRALSLTGLRFTWFRIHTDPVTVTMDSMFSYFADWTFQRENVLGGT